MNPSLELRRARARVGLSQVSLAARAGTSQATVSAYESGRKLPSLDTFSRLLAAAGGRLTVAAGPAAPSDEEHARAAGVLLEVLALAEALPARHEPVLRFPRIAPRPPS